jgi:hypothetical protein
MTTTSGQPEYHTYGADWRHPTSNPWAQEAIAARGYSDFDPAQPEPDEAAPEPVELVAGANRSPRRTAAVTLAVLADAGMDVADIDDLSIDGLTDTMREDLTEDEAENALAALDRALAGYRELKAPVAPHGESDGAYKVREGNWRERIGQGRLPRRRTHLPPSQMPDVRRLKRLQKRVDAGEFSSIQEAQSSIQRRQMRPRKPKATP